MIAGRRCASSLGIAAAFPAAKATLLDVIVNAAGARNLARSPMAAEYRKPKIEALLKLDPALIAQGSPDAAAASLGAEVTRHRLV